MKKITKKSILVYPRCSLASLNHETLMLMYCCSLSIYQKLRISFISPENQLMKPCTKTKTSTWSATNAIDAVTPKNDADVSKFVIIATETTTKLTISKMNLKATTVKKASCLKLVSMKWKKVRDWSNKSKLGARCGGR